MPVPISINNGIEYHLHYNTRGKLNIAQIKSFCETSGKFRFGNEVGGANTEFVVSKTFRESLKQIIFNREWNNKPWPTYLGDIVPNDNSVKNNQHFTNKGGGAKVKGILEPISVLVYNAKTGTYHVLWVSLKPQYEGTINVLENVDLPLNKENPLKLNFMPNDITPISIKNVKIQSLSEAFNKYNAQAGNKLSNPPLLDTISGKEVTDTEQYNLCAMNGAGMANGTSGVYTYSWYPTMDDVYNSMAGDKPKPLNQLDNNIVKKYTVNANKWKDAAKDPGRQIAPYSSNLAKSPELGVEFVSNKMYLSEPPTFDYAIIIATNEGFTNEGFTGGGVLEGFNIYKDSVDMKDVVETNTTKAKNQHLALQYIYFFVLVIAFLSILYNFKSMSATNVGIFIFFVIYGLTYENLSAFTIGQYKEAIENLRYADSSIQLFIYFKLLALTVLSFAVPTIALFFTDIDDDYTMENTYEDVEENVTSASDYGKDMIGDITDRGSELVSDAADYGSELVDDATNTIKEGVDDARAAVPSLPKL
tara:strand:- start:3984 stop:5579 length:1596 start_codon:yes stop_codon:yes gene_type:complete